MREDRVVIEGMTLTPEEIELIKKFRKRKQDEEQREDNIIKGFKMMQEGYDLIFDNDGKVVIEDPDNYGNWEEVSSLELRKPSNIFDTVVIYF